MTPSDMAKEILETKRQAIIRKETTMTNLKIVPQKFSFEKPTITNGKGETTSYGMNVSIEIDAFKADKEQIKKDLASIFAEVLEYFD